MKAQKRLALVATTLILSSSAHANFLKDLLDKFQSINKAEKTECAKMSNDEVAALCLQEVCGDAAKHPVILNAETIKRYNTEIPAKKMEEIAEKLRVKEKEIQNIVEAVSKRVEHIKALNSPDQLDDKAADNIIHHILAAISEEHKLLQKVNPFKSKGEKIRLILPPKSPYAQIYKDLISKINLEQHPSLRKSLKLKASDTEYQIYLQKSEELQKEIAKRKLSSNYNFEIDKWAADIAIKDNKFSIDYYLSLKREADRLGIELEPQLCNADCKKQVFSYIKNVPLFDPQEVAKKAREQIDLDDAIAECQATVSLTHVEAKNSDEIQKEWPLLIKRLENDTRLKLSSHSKELLLKKIEKDLNVKFNTPIEARGSVIREQGSIYVGDPQVIDLVDSLYFVSKEGTKKFAEAVATPRCAKLKQTISLNDHVLFEPAKNKGDLVVSPFSCEHVHLGKEIMAHELGHAVSYFMAFTPEMSAESKEEFVKLRACSRAEKRTTKFGSFSAIHENDKWTTEEDTADLFSYALSTDSQSMMGCALTVPDGEAFKVTGMRKSFFDTHSSGIQRLMVELQYKNPGMITEACAEVIDRSKSKITNKCL